MTMTSAAAPHVKSGSIVVLRHFDVAYSIDLVQVEALCTARTRTASQRGRLNSVPEKALSFGVPPVSLALGPSRLVLGGREAEVEVTARIYDFGAVVLAARLPVGDLSWDDFVTRVAAMDQTIGPSARHPLWETLLGQVRELIAPALLRPSHAGLEEDYLLAEVREFTEPLRADELQARVDLAPLLSGETRALSAAARRDLLRRSFSYYEDDLVVLTWDRAFIYEPRGDSDVADVLEVANSQLLELRYYDELLDAELPRMYDLVEAVRGAASLFAARRFARLARHLYTLVAEVTELTEKVDNALQVTEDVYLARIYTAALDLFRVPKLSAAVDRKLAIVRDTYAALYEEASSSRAEALEIAIVLLIALEIVLALLRH
jgi:hypothetical protein